MPGEEGRKLRIVRVRHCLKDVLLCGVCVEYEKVLRACNLVSIF